MQKDFTLYYTLSDGSVRSESQVADAFTITTGLSRYKSEWEYLNWLYNLIQDGKICGVFKSTNATDEDIHTIALNGQMIQAIRLYAQAHGVSPIEAKTHVEEMVKNHNEGGEF